MKVKALQNRRFAKDRKQSKQKPESSSESEEVDEILDSDEFSSLDERSEQDSPIHNDDENGGFENIDDDDDDEAHEEEEEEQEEEKEEEEIVRPPLKRARLAFEIEAENQKSVKEPKLSKEASKMTEAEIRSKRFKLQADALLGEVKPSKEVFQNCEAFLRTLRDALFSVSAATSPSQNAVLLENGLADVLHADESNDCEARFVPPSQIRIVGSFLLRCTIRPRLNVDVACEIPSECFLQKDFTHGRYFRKRAAWLFMYAKQLQKKLNKLGVTIKVSDFNGDKFRPVLELSAAELMPFTVRILPCPSDTQFSLEKLYSRSLFAIAEDATLVPHLAYLHDQFLQYDNLLAVASLVRVWLHQRPLLERFVSPFMLTMCIAKECTTNPLLKHADLYHFFKVSMKAVQSAAASGSLTDVSGSFSLSHACPSWVLRRLAYEAGLAVQFMDAEDFSGLFLQKVDPLFSFDGFYVFSRKVGQTELAQLCEKVESAISGRVRCVCPVLDSLSGRHAQYSMIGFLLTGDTSEAYKQVVMGPAADGIAEEIDAFRGIWKDRAEVRRFKDGAICWSAVFPIPSTKKIVGSKRASLEDVTLCRRTFILEEIFQFLVGDSKGHILMDPILPSLMDAAGEGDDTSAKLEYASAYAIRVAFSELQSMVIQCASLPLQIISVHCTDPAARNTSSHLSAYTDDRRVVPVVVILESSSRWPANAQAIARLKTAMAFRMAQELESKYHCACRLTEQYLDVNLRRADADSKKLTFRLLLRSENPLEITTLPVKDALVYERETKYAVQHHMWSLDLSLKFVGRYGEACRLLERWLVSHGLSGYFTQEWMELIVAAVFHPRLCSPYGIPQSSWIAFLRALRLIGTVDWRREPIDIRGMSGEEVQKVLERDAVKKQSDSEKVVEGMDGPQESDVSGKSVKRGGRHTFKILYDLDPEFGHRWSIDGPEEMIVDRMQTLARKSLANHERCVLKQSSQSAFAKEYEAEVMFSAEDSRLAMVVQDMDMLIRRRVFASRTSRQPWCQFMGLDTLYDCYPEDGFLSLLRKQFENYAFFFELDKKHIGVVFKPLAFLPTQLRISSSFCAFPLDADCAAEGPMKSTTVIPNVFELVHEIKSIGKGVVESMDFVVRGDQWENRCSLEAQQEDSDPSDAASEP
eukprot:ANDGO_05191.mRNA.1 U3 small nucleolar RNA-associated protein 22